MDYPIITAKQGNELLRVQYTEDRYFDVFPDTGVTQLYSEYGEVETYSNEQLIQLRDALTSVIDLYLTKVK